MAAKTSNAVTGNYNAGASWVGGVAPVAGDTLTIVAGAVITVTANETIGSSPSTGGTAAINVSGALVVAAAVTLVAKGDILLNNAPYTMGAGSVLEFDVPAGQHYVLQTATANYQNNMIVTVTGTAGARAVIRAKAGGGTAALHMDGGGGYRGFLTFRYTDFLRLGTASIAAIERGGGATGTFDLEQCVFDTCGKILAGNSGAAHLFRLVNVTMKNTVASLCYDGDGSSAALSGGVRLIQSSVFDKTLVSAFRDYTITDTILSDDNGGIAILGAVRWAAFTNNLMQWTVGGESTHNGDISNCYFLSTHTSTNPHWLQAEMSCTISGCIFEYLGTANNGDCTQPGASGTPYTVTVEHCLGILNGGGGTPGTIVSLLGNANTTWVVRHDTWVAHGQSCVNIGETYAGHAGELDEFRDNLCWYGGTADTFKLHDVTGTVVDHVAAADCHHNAGFNTLPGSNLKGYDHLLFSTGAPGASDVDGVDPDFVDETRNIASWDATLPGGAGTTAHALTELKKKNEAGYNTSYTIASLVTWVKAGFVPQAAAMHAASDTVAISNGWIGALEGAAPSSGGYTFITSHSEGSTDGADFTTSAMNTSGCDLLVVVLTSYTAVVATVSDSKGNTWAYGTMKDSATSRVRIGYAVAPTVGTGHTFTVVTGTTGYTAICIAGFHGAKPTSPFDQQNGADGAFLTNATGPVTPSEKNELLVTGISRPGIAIVSINGGFTIAEDVPYAAGLHFGSGLAYLIQTSAAPANPTWTFDGNTNGAAVIATFKAGAAAAAPAGDLMLLGVG